jgi:dipeptidyl-peptidase-3
MMKITTIFAVSLLLACIPLSGCLAREDEEGRVYLVESIDDLVVYRVYIDGFEDLTADEKILAYWLTQAAIAGRDIFYHQMHEKGLDIKRVVETSYPIRKV